MRTKILPILLLSALAGCSGNAYNERTDYKTDAGSVAALEMPPGLVLPKMDDHYTIPGSTAAATPPKLQNVSGGGKDILLSEPFDRCWLSVEQALDTAAILVDDKDRSKGLFYLKGGQQVVVKADTTTCTVSANDGSGKTSDETSRTIDALYKSLSK